MMLGERVAETSRPYDNKYPDMEAKELQSRRGRSKAFSTGVGKKEEI